MQAQIVNRVDHVFTCLEDVRSAYDFLTDTLRLPVAWPYTPYGDATVSGAGIGLGNLHLEVLGSDDALPPDDPMWGYPFFRSSRPARISGIAFDPIPVDDSFLAELDRRGIRHSPAYTAPGPDGDPAYTNVFLGGFIGRTAEGGSGPDSIVFVCRYHDEQIRDETRRREELVAAGGGLLGVQEAAALVIGTTDLDRSTHRWQRLLDPLPPSDPATWGPGWGPAIRIEEADEDAILALVLSVRSVEEARRALRDLDVPTETEPGGLRIRPGPLAGLEIRLRARRT